MAVYSPDKPESCRHCYFWKRNKKSCNLGVEKCYYLMIEKPKEKNDCDECPYGRDHPCIGWCTKKIMQELRLHK